MQVRNQCVRRPSSEGCQVGGIGGCLRSHNVPFANLRRASYCRHPEQITNSCPDRLLGKQWQTTHWNKKGNPEPWNKLPPNYQYKFLAVKTDYKNLKKDRPDF
uniref:Uncharacterized protein n=1 Tax=Eptatretus burgeri TaxID=7764 RepID=A0A8C4QSD9_EPTBU